MNPSKTTRRKFFALPVDKIRNRFLRGLVRCFAPIVEWLVAFPKLNAIYRDVLSKTDDIPFETRVLQSMRITVGVTDEDLSRLPKTGPVVVVSNHPFGGIEGVILIERLKTIRPDVKAMANYLLGAIPEMKEDFIFVDPFASANSIKSNLRPMKECLLWLEAGHVLIIFPSGEVSHFDWHWWRVRDPKWQPNVASIILKSKASVVPAFFFGHNGWFFQLAGMIHPLLRTALLPREFANKCRKTLRFTVGSALPNKVFDRFQNDRQRILHFLRFRSEMLAERAGKTVKGPIQWVRSLAVSLPLGLRSSNRLDELRNQEAIIPRVPLEELESDLANLPPDCKLIASGDSEVYVAAAAQLPHVLREIGRLREETFRAVGEGTGKSIDLDPFDQTYRHLFMWNKAKREIVGAYRLGLTDEIIRDQGVKGLYTRTLFEYNDRLLQEMPPAVEMGRSFVRQEYQKAFTSLFLLWKGISLFLAHNPRYRVLFGPVSITNEYLETSRALMVSSLKLNYMNAKLSPLVKPTTPPKEKRRFQWYLQTYQECIDNIDQVAGVVAEIEPDGKDIPVLLRQYLKLNGKFLAFNVDPDFSSVIDGLVVVDLADSEEKTVRRYMGNELAEQYFRYHGIHQKPQSAEAAG